MAIITQAIISTSAVTTHHPDYDARLDSWEKIRTCLQGEDAIKDKKEKYLPRPAGMSGDYADAYDSYIERAHFPLIVPYALSGALGIVITKLPEFNVPTQLEYILKDATKDGRSIQQLFLDIIIEIMQTGRVPLLVDVLAEKNEFRFVDYKAEHFINWKSSIVNSEKNLTLGVLTEDSPDTEDIFSHDTVELQRVLSIDPDGNYSSRVFEDSVEYIEFKKIPSFMGTTIQEIPLFLAGSINNSFDMQPIPLVSVANCSVQIYRKEADLANSEFLSCNPTLCLVGASNDDDLPNVVGSSVMMVIPNEAARIFYTTTDTAALKHVSDHIDSLYEEAIRHGVAILDSRKGVESAEALRIRQATQSASIYSVFLSAMNAIKQGLTLMCRWAGYNEKEVVLDAPATLTQGIPDASLIQSITAGFTSATVPLSTMHRYLVDSGLLDQTVGYEDYLEILKKEAPLRISLTPIVKSDNSGTTDGKENPISLSKITKKDSSKKQNSTTEGGGVEDTL